ncbi:MAG: histidine kinase [Campylobacter sputorum]|uniref:hypothetical protein n=1 Tax=Campylobacter sputorum TaxID=206 RepID=UPI000B76CBE8|nr:hypothetical protein [Campylobacter sputorum]ASM39248.1 hypothetical protein CSPARA_1721 [Campylobacter sputorum bv. paraureolyticus LMG 11764]MDY6121400.1 histidine kinase [Campylobacter sputorum]
MRNLKYKNIAIKAFYDGNYELAKTCFSMLYETMDSKFILILINICELAKTNKNEAQTIFDIVLKKMKNKENPDDLNSIIEILESKFENTTLNLMMQNAISYSEFMSLVKDNGNFKNTFENIMFSSKVMISNRDDLLEFLDNLIQNGFIELGLNYLESAAQIFPDDERLHILIKQISQRQENENRI